jgi:hypothetical protein
MMFDTRLFSGSVLVALVGLGLTAHGCDAPDGGHEPGNGGDSTDQDTGLAPQVDEDGDGYSAEEDCDDLDAAVNPGAVDVPYDGIDQDCDGSDLTDVDGDGYLGEQVGGYDCDDEDSSIHPYAGEYCTGSEDRDCDGDVGLYDDDCCELSCSCSGSSFSAGLSCGTGSRSCSYSYDSHGRPISAVCSYSNDTWFGCSISYDSAGGASGDCHTYWGGDDTCSFNC